MGQNPEQCLPHTSLSLSNLFWKYQSKSRKKCVFTFETVLWTLNFGSVFRPHVTTWIFKIGYPYFFCRTSTNPLWKDVHIQVVLLENTCTKISHRVVCSSGWYCNKLKISYSATNIHIQLFPLLDIVDKKIQKNTLFAKSIQIELFVLLGIIDKSWETERLQPLYFLLLTRWPWQW